MTEFNVGSTNEKMRGIRVGHPGTWRMWMRWWEPIENVLDNAWTCDMSSDWDEHMNEFLQTEGIPGIFPRPVYPNYSDHIADWNEFYAAYRKNDDNWWAAYRETVYEAYEAYDGTDARWTYSRQDSLLRTLEDKRDDGCWEDVLASIKEHGFLRCLTVSRDVNSKYGYRSGDGHHRLAAAIDLGFTHVPYQWTPQIIAADSGEWQMGNRIALNNSIRNSNGW